MRTDFFLVVSRAREKSPPIKSRERELASVHLTDIGGGALPKRDKKERRKSSKKDIGLIKQFKTKGEYASAPISMRDWGYCINEVKMRICGDEKLSMRAARLFWLLIRQWRFSWRRLLSSGWSLPCNFASIWTWARVSSLLEIIA